MVTDMVHRTSGLRLGLVVGLMLALSGGAWGHNGSVAHAVALQDSIVVDGDLSDWPADIEWHEINRVEAFHPPRGSNDLQARFAVGLADSGRIVHVAVHVEDDVWINPDDKGWASSDGVEIYFAVPHETHPIQLEMRGDHHSLRFGESVVMVRVGRVRTYEWRVSVARLKGAAESGIDRLTADGLPMGFDVVVLDDDDPTINDQSWVSWGRQSNKVSHAHNMGDLVAADPAQTHGTIKAQVRWPDGTSVRRFHMWMGPEGEDWDWGRYTDEHGRLDVQLPAGSYVFYTGSDTATVEVTAGGESHVALKAQLHRLTRPLGTGTTVELSAPTTENPWLTIPELARPGFGNVMAEDSSGGIWVASGGRGGSDKEVLTHYANGRVTTYNSADGIATGITGLTVDADNRLWITNWRTGLQSLFEGELTSYSTSPRQPTGTNDLAAEYGILGAVGIVADGAGRMWLSTYAGVAMLDDDRLQSFTQQDGISSEAPLAPSADGVWIAGQQQVVHMAADGAITRLDTARMSDYRSGSDLLVQGDDVWIAEGDRVWHFDGDVEREIPAPSDRITSLSVDSGGRPWIGTWGDGAFVYEDTAWIRHSTVDGLANDQVLDIHVDRRNRVWAVGLVGGVSRLDREHREVLTTEDGLGHNLMAGILADNDGSMWFGGYNGYVTKKQGDSLRTWLVGEYEGNWGGMVWDLVQDGDGTIWARQENILLRLHDDQWKRVDVGNTVGTWGIHPHEGQLWVHIREDGGSSLYRHRDGKFHREYHWSVEASVWFATDGEGELWAGASVHGGGPDRANEILRWDGEVWHKLESVEGLANAGGSAGVDGAFGQMMVGLYQFGDRVLVELYDRPNRNLSYHWLVEDALDAVDGPLTLEDLELFHNDAIRDARGRLWVPTWGNGLLVTDGLVRQRYQRIDGLAHDGVQRITADQRGDIWITTESGVSRYRPTEEPPSVRIVDVIADGSLGAIEQLGVPVTSGFVRIEFEGFSDSTPPDRMAFVYRLHPDDEWTAHYEPFLELRDLPRGDYTIEVKAVDRDLNYSAEPARLALTVHLPYERMSWAGGLFLAVLLVGWQTTRVVKRDRRLSSQNRELTIEGSLERVRAEVASMSGMEGLGRVIEVSQAALNDIGLDIQGFTFIAIDGETGQAKMQDSGSGFTHFDMKANPDASELFDHWRQGESFQRFLTSDGFHRWVVDVPSEFGTLAMGRVGRPFDDGEIALLKRFAEVAEAGYRRYLDFQHLEEQNDALAKARDTAETANRAKSQFLANMSHEIRTPMNAILGYAQILRRSDDLTADHRHAVDTIQSSGDHLLNLINDVLDISKIEAGRMELAPSDFDLKQMLETLGVMFEMHCREKQLSWDLDGLPEHALPVHADEAKLRQVVINLLGNAVKFTTAGGVSLRLLRHPDGDGNGVADRYRIEVVDSGPGLSAEEQEAIFQPFHQGSAGHEQGGTGLGLAITQRHLELMGSELVVTSAPGAGSTFAFDIDLPPAHAKLATAPVSEVVGTRRLAEGQSVRVVLADDVRANRDILETMLLDIGAEVHTTTNGREALEAVQADKPDIVFLDVRMPVMDGLESVKQMRQLDGFGDIKAVAISASVLEHERQSYLESGFDDFIDKPFHFDRVCSALVEQLDVRFDEGIVSDSDTTGVADNFDDARVPDDMRARLVEAAELYSVTEIEQLSAQLADVGEAESRLADRLRQLSQAQDMEGIVSLLNNVAVHS